MTSTSQAVVFLTHVESAAVFGHFQRLKREVHPLLESFLCLHQTSPRVASTPQPRILVTPQDGARVLPSRHAEMERTGRAFSNGFPDVAYIPAFADSRLEPYDYLWLVEYDVDYAGDWQSFVVRTMGSRADFLGTTIFSRKDCSDWWHWRDFGAPPKVTEKYHLRSFNPVLRLSRTMLDCYIRAVNDDRWQGHA
jgi:hypothetical protein